ncbi:MAG: EAL domain-containing protein [Cellvibrio sp.]
MINFLRRSLGSPSLLLVILIAATVGGILWVVKVTIIEQDKLFIVHSEEMVISGLDQRGLQFVGDLHEYSIWDAMDENANSETLNTEWLKINMSGSAYANQNINIAAIVDRQRRINYLLIDGKLVPPDTRTRNVAQLVESFYPFAERYNPFSGAPSPVAYMKTTEAGVDTYYVVVMEAIASENQTNILPNARFILFATVLDERWLDELGENFKLVNPDISSQMPVDQPGIPLKNLNGEVQGYLRWQLDMPGTRIFSSILPYVLVLLCVLTSIAVLLGRLASRLQATQLAQAQRLAAQGEALRSLALSKDATSEAYTQEAAILARVTLQLQHLSVWELSQDQKTLNCRVCIEQPEGLAGFGKIVERNQLPWLFDVLDRKSGMAISQIVAAENPEYWLNLGAASAVLAVPTLVRDQATGVVLALNPKTRQWRPDEVNFLASIADMLALSIESQARKHAEQKLSQRIYFDELTGLPNRVCLSQKVQELVFDSSHHSKYVCVLVNVEGLVLINDKYGVATGDQLLEGVARRLEHFCGTNELVGRVGDNRFALVLDLERGVNLTQRMDMLFGFFSSPVKAKDISLMTRLNIGVSHLQWAREWALVLHNAEIALHSLHRANRENAWVEYSLEHHAAEQEEQALREELQQALARGEFFLVYQPIINLNLGNTCGAEALIRWQNPTRGLISPVTFIPIAEATGSIYEIGLWVLRTALRQIKIWQQETQTPLTMSVNVSMIQLEHASFAEDVCRILTEESVNPDALELEVTEGIALSSAPAVEQNLTHLRFHKIKLAIDDFGTGYASFSYLRRFEVGKLKIDRMFLDGVPDQKRNTNLVNTIIAMAHTLNAQVTGEGIETPEQAAFLREAGCEFGQGFYIGRPMSEADFLLRLQAN